MAATRGAFDKLLAPGLFDVYADEYKSLPALYPQVFNILSTRRAYEDIVVTSGLDTTPVKPEIQDVAMDRPFQIGTVRMTVISYGLGYEVSQELVDDDLYGAVAKPASRFLAQSGRDTEERIAWAMLNTAFTTQQAWDGVSIINTAHPLKSGATYANRPASVATLGFTALQASLERFKLMVNERGLKIRIRPVSLVVPVQLGWLAHEILDSSQKPFTADNTTNVMARGRIGLTIIESEFLTSATGWFLMAAKGVHRLNFFWRSRPKMDSDFDKKAQAALFMNFFRFGTASFDWRGVDGSTG